MQSCGHHSGTNQIQKVLLCYSFINMMFEDGAILLLKINSLGIGGWEKVTRQFQWCCVCCDRTLATECVYLLKLRNHIGSMHFCLY